MPKITMPKKSKPNSNFIKNLLTTASAVAMLTGNVTGANAANVVSVIGNASLQDGKTNGGIGDAAGHNAGTITFNNTDTIIYMGAGAAGATLTNTAAVTIGSINLNNIAVGMFTLGANVSLGSVYDTTGGGNLITVTVGSNQLTLIGTPDAGGAANTTNIYTNLGPISLGIAAVAPAPGAPGNLIFGLTQVGTNGKYTATIPGTIADLATAAAAAGSGSTVTINANNIITFDGAIGAANPLGFLTLGNNSQAIFNAATIINTLNYTADDGQVTANADFTGNVDFADTDSTFILGAGKTLTGSVDSNGADVSGTLIFAGGGTVTGPIGKTKNLILIGFTGPGNVTLEDEVNVTKIDFASNNSIIQFAVGAAIKIGSVDSGNPAGGAPGAIAGTLIFAGDAGVTGTIGVTNGLTKIGFSNIGTLTLGGNTNVTKIDFANNASTVSVLDGVTITGSILSTGATNGILSFVGNGAVTGTVGTAGAGLASIVVQGGAGTNVNLESGGVATEITYGGAGALIVGNAAAASTFTGAVDFKGQAGTFTVANAVIDGAVNDSVGGAGGASPGFGTLTFTTGNGGVTGAIGATKALSLISFNAGGNKITLGAAVNAAELKFLAGDTVTASGAINTTTIDFNGQAGTFIAKATINGAVDNSNLAAVAGTLTFNAAGSGVTGIIGGKNKLSLINFDAGGAVTLGAAVNAAELKFLAGDTVTASGAVTATKIDFNGQAGIFNVAAGNNLTADIFGDSTTRANSNKGTVIFEGVGTLSAGAGNSNGFGLLQAGAAGANVTIAGVNAINDVQISNAGGTITFSDGAELLSFTDGAGNTIGAGSINATGGAAGNIIFLGNTTINGSVGSATYPVGTITVNSVAGKTVNLESGGVATGITYAAAAGGPAAGNVIIGGNFTGSVDFNNQAGTFTVADGVTITDSVVSTGGTAGSLVFIGDGTVNAMIGTVAPAVTQIDSITVQGNNTKTVTLKGGGAAVNVKTLTYTNASNVVLSPNVAFTGNIDFAGKAGTFSLAANQPLTGSVVSTGAVAGTLLFAGGNTVTGNIGTSATALGKIQFTGGGNLQLQGNINNVAIIDFNNQGSTVTVAAGNDLTADIFGDSGNADHSDNGTVIFAGGGTLSAGAGNSNGFGVLQAGAAGKNVIIAGVNAINDVQISDAGGTITFADGAKLLSFTNQAGNVVLGKGTINASAGAAGNIIFLGNATIAGAVGSATYPVGTITVSSAASKIVNLKSGGVAAGITYAADAAGVPAAGNVTIGGNFTGNVDFKGQAGTFTVANAVITGAVDQTTGGLPAPVGTLTFTTGKGGVTGSIGNANPLSLISFNTGGGAVGLNSAKAGVIKASTLQFITADAVTAYGAVTGNVDFAGKAGTFTLDDGQTITGNVVSTGGVAGGLLFAGAGSVNGTIGTAGQPLNYIQTGSNAKTVTLNGSAYANNVYFANAASQINLVAGKDGSGNIIPTSLTGNIIPTSKIFNDTIVAIVAGGDTVAAAIQAVTNNGGDIRRIALYAIGGCAEGAGGANAAIVSAATVNQVINAIASAAVVIDNAPTVAAISTTLSVAIGAAVNSGDPTQGANATTAIVTATAGSATIAAAITDALTAGSNYILNSITAATTGGTAVNVAINNAITAAISEFDVYINGSIDAALLVPGAVPVNVATDLTNKAITAAVNAIGSTQAIIDAATSGAILGSLEALPGGVQTPGGILTLDVGSQVIGSITGPGGAGGEAISQISLFNVNKSPTFANDANAIQLGSPGSTINSNLISFANTGYAQLNGSLNFVNLVFNNATDTLAIGDNVNLTAASANPAATIGIIANADGNGTIIFNGGSSTSSSIVNSTIGTTKSSVGAIELQGAGKVSFNKDIYVTTLTIANAAALAEINGNLTSGTIAFTANGTLSLLGNRNYTVGAITTTAANQGNVTIGSSSVFGQTISFNGNIGTAGGGGLSGTSLQTLDLQGNSTIEFGAGVTGVYIKTVQFSADGSVDFNSNGAMYGFTEGILNNTAAGSAAAPAGTINIAADSILVANAAGGTINIGKIDTELKTINFAADNTLTIKGDTQINASSLTTASDNTGALSFSGANNVLNAKWSGPNALKSLQVTGGDTSISQDFGVYGIKITGGGTLSIGGSLVARDLTVKNNGTINLNDGTLISYGNITAGGINATGGTNNTLTFYGQAASTNTINSVIGVIGTGFQTIEIVGGDINFLGNVTHKGALNFDGGTPATVTFNSTTDIGTAAINNNSGVLATINIQSNTTFTNNITSNQVASQVVINMLNGAGPELTTTIQAKNLASTTITTDSPGKGNVIINNAAAKIGGIGALGAAINSLRFTSSGEILNEVFATTITVPVGSTATFDSNTNANTLTVDGTAVYQSGANPFNPITGTGQVQFGGSTLIKQPIGDINAASGLPNLNSISFADAPSAAVSLQSNLIANTIALNKSTVSVGSNVTLTGNVIANGTTINLASNNLTVAGSLEVGGALALSTNIGFNQATESLNGGTLSLNGSSLSVANLTDINITIDDQTNLGIGNQSYSIVFIKNTGGAVSDATAAGLAKITPVLTVSNSNRYTLWTAEYDNSGQLILVRGSNAKPVLNEELKSLANNSNITLEELNEIIDSLVEAPAGTDASQLLNALGQLTENETVEIIKRVFNSTAEGLAAVVSNNITSSAHRISDRTSSLKGLVGAGDENMVYGLWVSPFGGVATQKIYHNVAGNKAKFYGADIGVDTKLNEDISLGIAISKGEMDVKHKDYKKGDKTRLAWVGLSVYGLQNLNDNWSLQGAINISSNDVKSRDNRIIPNGKEEARSKYNIISNSIDLRVNSKVDLQNWGVNAELQPFAGLTYSRSSEGGYKETGTTYQNLTILRGPQDQWNGLLGVKAVGKEGYRMFDNALIIPEAHASINFAVGKNKTKLSLKLDGMNQAINKKIKGTPNMYNVGASLKLQYGNVDWKVGYDADMAKKFVSQQGTLKVNVNI